MRFVEDCCGGWLTVQRCLVGVQVPPLSFSLSAYARARAMHFSVFVKERLASYSYPREIEFLEALPMTVTGKVIRKELKARASAEVEKAK